MTKILDVMKAETVAAINAAKLSLIGSTRGESKDPETAAVTPYVKVEVEVAKGYGGYSRKRFTAKVSTDKILVADEALEREDYVVSFKNLSISYIDEKGNVYFRADDYSVKKEV